MLVGRGSTTSNTHLQFILGTCFWHTLIFFVGVLRRPHGSIHYPFLELERLGLDSELNVPVALGDVGPRMADRPCHNSCVLGNLAVVAQIGEEGCDLS